MLPQVDPRFVFRWVLEQGPNRAKSQVVIRGRHGLAHDFESLGAFGKTLKRDTSSGDHLGVHKLFKDGKRLGLVLA